MSVLAEEDVSREEPSKKKRKVLEPTTHYKFRAETLYDVIGFLNLHNKSGDASYVGKLFDIKIRAMDIDGIRIPDVDVDLWTTLTLDELRKLFDQVEDGHVMWGSVNYAEKYTGERYFEFDEDEEEV